MGETALLGPAEPADEGKSDAQGYRRMRWDQAIAGSPSRRCGRLHEDVIDLCNRVRVGAT